MDSILELTDHDSSLTVDLASATDGLTGVSETGLPGISATSFCQVLKSEMARANRYNFLVSLLLLGIFPPPGSKCATERDRLSELACLLSATLRTTDYLGSLGNGLVGVIAPHSDLDTAALLLERLQTESVFSVFRRKTGCEIRAAYSVYPTDASTMTSLFSIALERIR